MSALPIRPRLADHALVRRHVIDGAEIVVIHDSRTGDLLRMGPREWDLVAGADGTRDFDALVLAAARRGALRRASEVRAVLDYLHAAGLLADGLGYPPPAEAVDPARPLDVLSAYALTCDGSGDCCSMYGSVIFTPLEAARARAIRPEVLGAGDREERAFTPDRGSLPVIGGADGALAVALVDGRCAYLADDRRCSIHVAAGEMAKPRGCRIYPASFVDDGEVVRVSVGAECPCVLASVGREGGAPLVDPGARTRADLGPARIAMLPDVIPITAAAGVPRAAFVAWSRAVAGCLPEVADGAADALGIAWSLAAAVDAHGLDATAAQAAVGAPRSPEGAELAPLLDALVARARARIASADAWRGAQDRSRRASHWIAAAAERLLDPAARAAFLADGGRYRQDEIFFLRAQIHGHQLAGEIPVAAALRDRAVRLLLSRALPDALPEGDPARPHPLALVEAMMRGHGLAAYARAAREAG
ncbi:MAG: YkgJ family cysteine cluster protein [Minicystis sp.]